MRLSLLYLLTALVVLTVFGLSWLPQPRLGLNGQMPTWVAQWTDTYENMNIRTSVQFVLLGFLGGIWLVNSNKALRYWPYLWLCLLAIVTIAEMGQLMLPYRHFDFGDILRGGIGAYIGISPLLIYYIIRSGFRID